MNLRQIAGNRGSLKLTGYGDVVRNDYVGQVDTCHQLMHRMSRHRHILKVSEENRSLRKR